MKKYLILLTLILAATNLLVAQQYHEEDKEDLRIFMRQGTNYQNLGLSVQDTMTWYENENWVPKVSGISWIETEESILRIGAINWGYRSLVGKLKLSSPVLIGLNCSSNGLTKLDVSNNIYLTTLSCNKNYLTELDVSNNIYLEGLGCGWNNLTELDVSNNIHLKYLICYINNLTELDVSNCVNLQILECFTNNLTELDVSDNVRLFHLHCYENNLTKLDVRNNIHLHEFDCSWNNITELLVNKYDTFYYVYCLHNKLKFSTLPIIFVETVFAYSPQDTIYGGIRLYTDTIDLSSEYEIEGYITTYKWFDITGGYEEDIEQPTNENGIFYFTEAHANKRLRCKMSNEKFPVGYPAVFWFVYETDIVDGIKEISINTWEAYPNITNSESVVTLDLENSGNLIITLNDVLGNEVLELYNNYAYIGTFTKEFSIKCLPQGLYYIKAIHNGNIKIGKIIKM